MFLKPFGLGVKALVADEQGQVLFIRRSEASKWFKHKWDLPGGKVDAGEPFDAALVREVAEETGLVVSLDGVAGAAEYEMPAVRVAILFMEARRTGGQVRLSSEHDSFQWVKREQILELDLCDQLRSFLEDYCQRRSLHD